MQTLLQAYHKELAHVAGFAPDTVENYEICLGKFFDFAAGHLNIDPLGADIKDLLRWMTHLKEQNLSRSRLTHHKAALKHFFGLLVKLKQCRHKTPQSFCSRCAGGRATAINSSVRTLLLSSYARCSATPG